MSPERGRTEGVTEWGCKGETDEGTCETFPRVSPFDEDPIVVMIITYKTEINRFIKTTCLGYENQTFGLPFDEDPIVSKIVS